MHGLELPVEELDALPVSLVQLVLVLQQLGELGKQSARKLHGGGRCAACWLVDSCMVLGADLDLPPLRLLAFYLFVNGGSEDAAIPPVHYWSLEAD